MRGWLKKLSSKSKSWGTRYFVLTRGAFNYYSGEDCAKLLGSIPLQKTRVREIANDSEKHAFEIRSAYEKQKLTPSHESYILAARSDDECKLWISALRRAVNFLGGCFGRALKEQLKLERTASKSMRTESGEIPYIVQRCLDFLTEHDAVEKDGIFRVGGRIKLQRDLRDEFDHGVNVSLDLVPELTVAEVSSLLKSYLQALPDSLIPSCFFEKLAPVGFQIQTLLLQSHSQAEAKTKSSENDQEEPQAAEQSVNDRQQDAQRLEAAFQRLKTTIRELPIDNFNLLQVFMHFLWLVHSNSKKNRMTANNLAITLWQVVLKPEDSTAEMIESVADMSIRTVTIIIEHYQNLFDQETCQVVRKMSQEQTALALTSSADVPDGNDSMNENEDDLSAMETRARVSFIEYSKFSQTPPRPSGVRVLRQQSDVRSNRPSKYHSNFQSFSEHDCKLEPRMRSKFSDKVADLSDDVEQSLSLGSDSETGDSPPTWNASKKSTTVAELEFDALPNEAELSSMYQALHHAYGTVCVTKYELEKEVALLRNKLSRYQAKYGDLDCSA